MNESSDSHRAALIFAIDEQRFALKLSVVERVVRAAEVTPVPRAPAILFGVLNVQGEIIPVINTRRQLGFSERDIRPSDQFIIARAPERVVALVADTVCDVVSVSESAVIAAEKIMPGAEFIEGVMKLEDGLVLIENLEKFLSSEEHKTIDESLKT